MKPVPSMKDAHSLADIATGNADIGEHVVVHPVEDFGCGVAALPLADRLKDVFHGHGFLVLGAARGLKKRYRAASSKRLERYLLRCRICRHSPGPNACQGRTTGMRKGHDLDWVPARSIFADTGRWAPAGDPMRGYPLVRSDLEGQGLGRALLEKMIRYYRSRRTGEVGGGVTRPNGDAWPSAPVRIQEPETRWRPPLFTVNGTAKSG